MINDNILKSGEQEACIGNVQGKYLHELDERVRVHLLRRWGISRERLTIERIVTSHSDVGGKKRVTSGVYGGNKYPTVTRGDFPRYIWMFFVSYKSNVADIFGNLTSGQKYNVFRSKVGVADRTTKENLMNKNSESFAEKKNMKQDSTSYCGQPRVQRCGRVRVGHDRVCSTTHILIPGFCNFPRTKNNMDPNARECFFLRPDRYHAIESKRALVRT